MCCRDVRMLNGFEAGTIGASFRTTSPTVADVKCGYSIGYLKHVATAGF